MVNQRMVIGWDNHNDDLYLIELSRQVGKQAWIGLQPPFDKEIVDILGSSNCQVDKKFYHRYRIVWIYEQLYDIENVSKQKKILREAVRLIDGIGKIIILVPNKQSFKLSDIEECLCEETQSKYSIEKEFVYKRNCSRVLVFDVENSFVVDESLKNNICTKQNKIAIIVEADYRSNHFSICSYFMSVSEALKEEGIVELITYKKTRQGVAWYKLSDKSEDVSTARLIVRRSRFFPPLMREVRHTIERNTEKVGYEQHYIGENLKNEGYSLCIISNPWVVSEDIKIDVDVIAGIVYDTIANSYVIRNKESFVEWGNIHHRGFEYYNKYCNRILTISDEIMRHYVADYPNVNKEKVRMLPPFPPYQYWNVELNESSAREKALILAAPFDPRKGVFLIPEYLNRIGNKVDRIYIFGKTRCSGKTFRDFFKKTRTRAKIIYYPIISYKDLIELYKRCRVLLFPSLDEGLGFPIIEAQICGCRVVTTNASPMKELIVDGGYLLSDDIKRDVNRICQMIEEDYPNASLSHKAKERYIYKNIEELKRRLIEA